MNNNSNSKKNWSRGKNGSTGNRRRPQNSVLESSDDYDVSSSGHEMECDDSDASWTHDAKPKKAVDKKVRKTPKKPRAYFKDGAPKCRRTKAEMDDLSDEQKKDQRRERNRLSQRRKSQRKKQDSESLQSDLLELKKKLKFLQKENETKKVRVLKRMDLEDLELLKAEIEEDPEYSLAIRAKEIEIEEIESDLKENAINYKNATRNKKSSQFGPEKWRLKKKLENAGNEQNIIQKKGEIQVEQRFAEILDRALEYSKEERMNDVTDEDIVDEVYVKDLLPDFEMEMDEYLDVFETENDRENPRSDTAETEWKKDGMKEIVFTSNNGSPRHGEFDDNFSLLNFDGGISFIELVDLDSLDCPSIDSSSKGKLDSDMVGEKGTQEFAFTEKCEVLHHGNAVKGRSDLVILDQYHDDRASFVNENYAGNGCEDEMGRVEIPTFEQSDCGFTVSSFGTMLSGSASARSTYAHSGHPSIQGSPRDVGLGNYVGIGRCDGSGRARLAEPLGFPASDASGFCAASPDGLRLSTDLSWAAHSGVAYSASTDFGLGDGGGRARHSSPRYTLASDASHLDDYDSDAGTSGADTPTHTHTEGALDDHEWMDQ